MEQPRTKKFAGFILMVSFVAFQLCLIARSASIVAFVGLSVVLTIINAWRNPKVTVLSAWNNQVTMYTLFDYLFWYVPPLFFEVGDWDFWIYVVREVIKIWILIAMELNPHCRHQNECWYEIPIQLPDRLRDWAHINVKTPEVQEYPKPHITILYGFECQHYPAVEKIVKSYNITSDDYTFGEPERGKIGPVYLARVKSDKLQKLFWELHKEFPNKHTLIDGQYDPHVTLVWVKPQYATWLKKDA